MRTSAFNKNKTFTLILQLSYKVLATPFMHEDFEIIKQN